MPRDRSRSPRRTSAGRSPPATRLRDPRLHALIGAYTGFDVPPVQARGGFLSHEGDALVQAAASRLCNRCALALGTLAVVDVDGPHSLQTWSATHRWPACREWCLEGARPLALLAAFASALRAGLVVHAGERHLDEAGDMLAITFSRGSSEEVERGSTAYLRALMPMIGDAHDSFEIALHFPG